MLLGVASFGFADAAAGALGVGAGVDAAADCAGAALGVFSGDAEDCAAADAGATTLCAAAARLAHVFGAVDFGGWLGALAVDLAFCLTGDVIGVGSGSFGPSVSWFTAGASSLAWACLACASEAVCCL